MRTDENGQTLKGRWTCTPDAGGTILVGRFELGEPGHPVYSSVAIFYWQPESQSISYVLFDSFGARGTYTYTRLGNQMVSQGTGYDAKGQLWSEVDEIQVLNDDTFVLRTTHRFSGGETMTDLPKTTFTRVKWRIELPALKP